MQKVRGHPLYPALSEICKGFTRKASADPVAVEQQQVIGPEVDASGLRGAKTLTQNTVPANEMHVGLPKQATRSIADARIRQASFHQVEADQGGCSPTGAAQLFVQKRQELRRVTQLGRTEYTLGSLGDGACFAAVTRCIQHQHEKAVIDQTPAREIAADDLSSARPRDSGHLVLQRGAGHGLVTAAPTVRRSSVCATETSGPLANHDASAATWPRVDLEFVHQALGSGQAQTQGS